MSSGLSWSDKLAAGRLFAIQKWPWMRAAIFGMIPHPVEGFDTFGITKDGILIVGIPAAEKWSVKEIGTVLVHETCHLLRNHASRRESIDPILKLWGWAVDAEINDDLREAQWPFPENPVFPEQFKLPEGLTAEEYYSALRDMLQEKTCSKCGQTYYELEDPNKKKKKKGKGGASGKNGKNEQDDQNDGGSGKGKKKKGKGKKKGQDSEGSGDKDQEKQKGKGAGQDKSQNGDSGSGDHDHGENEGDGECPMCSGHDADIFPNAPKAAGGWCGSGAGTPLPDEDDLRPQNVNGRTPVEQEIMRRQVAEAIQREASKGRGTVPGGWERWADRMLKPPKVNWRAKLARACRQTVARCVGAVDMGYHRPSRRQAGLGFGSGRAVLPSYFATIPSVTILVDTSGSMGDEELTEAVNESVGVMKAISAEVQFGALDAKMQEFQKVQHPRQLFSLLKGGGGTDFCVGFEKINKLPQRDKPRILVFITDGMGPAPEYPPPHIDVIWVLVGNCKQVPYSEKTSKPINWGEQIMIDDIGAREVVNGA